MAEIVKSKGAASQGTLSDPGVFVVDVDGELTLSVDNSGGPVIVPVWKLSGIDDKDTPNACFVDGNGSPVTSPPCSQSVTIKGLRVGQAKVTASAENVGCVLQPVIVGIGGIIVYGADGQWYLTRSDHWTVINSDKVPSQFYNSKDCALNAYLAPGTGTKQENVPADTTIVTCYLLNMNVMQSFGK